MHFYSLLNTGTGTTMYITFCCMQNATCFFFFFKFYLIVSFPDLCILLYFYGVVCILTIITPGRRQSKTLLTIDERGSKIARNSIFDCHLSPIGDKWQSKTLFRTIFYLRSTIVSAFTIAAYRKTK